MSFKSLREHKLLSQEQVAEASGLSLRTVQRAEAGHRVSYASLRALAVTLETDVDVLERELYAVRKPAGDFVEIPRWARILNGEGWYQGPTTDRRGAHAFEAFCLSCALLFFVLSFVVASGLMATLLRYGALFELVCCYLMSVSYRLLDAYQLWPAADTPSPRAPGEV